MHVPVFIYTSLRYIRRGTDVIFNVGVFSASVLIICHSTKTLCVLDHENKAIPQLMLQTALPKPLYSAS